MDRNRKIIIVIIAAFILILVGLFVYGYISERNNQAATLEFWGVFDDRSAVKPLIDGFQSTNSKIKINYTQFTDPVLYEQKLVDALAAGRGPDVFMFHNSWLPKHFDKLAPLTEEQLPLVQFRSLYPEVVEQDFAPTAVVYVLPLSVDTLALFYNRDDFNNASLPLPPKTWTEFESYVERLRKVNPSTNEIIHAGAAMGGSANSINRATDLLYLLMLQAGTQMVNNSFTQATFTTGGNETGILPGLEALNFYTQFANPSSPYYTWHEDLHYSLDNFQEEGVSMVFNYGYQAPQIKERNPFLNFEIGPMPQIAGSSRAVNFANYWGLGVANQSANVAIAQHFVITSATDANIMRQYSIATEKPPALRSLIQENINHPSLGVFANQALTARTWAQIDNVEIEKIISKMILDVTSGRVGALPALREAENSVNILMNRIRR